MKKFNNRYKIYILLSLFLLIYSSCGEKFLDINTDPNNPSEAQLGLVLPATQVAIASGFLGGTTSGAPTIDRATGAYVDMLHSPSFGRYLTVGSSFNGGFETFYSGALKDLESIIETTKENPALISYSGIAKLEKAYLYSMIVDLWGDVPFTEALSSKDPTYGTDGGLSTYKALFGLIDEGIAEITQGIAGGSTIPATADIIYKGNLNKWVKMGNTLKLKMYNQVRLVPDFNAAAEITALLSNPASLITDNADDFQFQFGTGIAPQNAHPRWIDDYNGSGRAGYFSNHFMTKLAGGGVGNFDKLSPNVQYGVPDPRIRYYFFRQTTFQPVGSPNIPCVFNNVGCTFFYPGSGYLGRDAGDNSVGPADVAVSTKYGVYPAGGLFDKAVVGSSDPTRLGKQLTVNDGTGRGIFPMITNFMVLFIQAESALTLNTPGDPRALLEAGIRSSIKKVMDFGDALDAPPADLKPTTAAVQTYVDAVLAKYDVADTEGKLEIIIDQFYVAIFGNSTEAYNSYRRTGYPKIYSPVDNNAAGPYPVRLVLPINETASNKNAPKEDLSTTPVFWDKK
jgi:hypothetical protein